MSVADISRAIIEAKRGLPYEMKGVIKLSKEIITQSKTEPVIATQRLANELVIFDALQLQASKTSNRRRAHYRTDNSQLGKDFEDLYVRAGERAHLLLFAPKIGKKPRGRS